MNFGYGSAIAGCFGLAGVAGSAGGANCRARIVDRYGPEAVT